MDKAKAIGVIEDFIRFWEDETQIVHYSIKEELLAFKMAVQALKEQDKNRK